MLKRIRIENFEFPVSSAGKNKMAINDTTLLHSLPNTAKTSKTEIISLMRPEKLHLKIGHFELAK